MATFWEIVRVKWNLKPKKNPQTSAFFHLYVILNSPYIPLDLFLSRPLLSDCSDMPVFMFVHEEFFCLLCQRRVTALVHQTEARWGSAVSFPRCFSACQSGFSCSAKLYHRQGIRLNWVEVNGSEKFKKHAQDRQRLGSCDCMCLWSFQSTDRHQGTERCCLLKVMYLKSHFPFQRVCIWSVFSLWRYHPERPLHNRC